LKVVGDMPESYDVLFASSNVHKYEEAKKFCQNLE